MAAERGPPGCSARRQPRDPPAPGHLRSAGHGVGARADRQRARAARRCSRAGRCSRSGWARWSPRRAVTIVDDPTNPAAFGASPVDGEGVPTRANHLVRDGRLEGFLHNLYTARRTGTPDDRIGGARVRLDAGRRCAGAAPAARDEVGGRGHGRGSRGALRAVGLGSALGDQPGERRLLGGCGGPDGARRCVRGAGARDHGRVDAASGCCTTCSAIGSDLTWLPGGTAGLTLLVADMTMAGA